MRIVSTIIWDTKGKGIEPEDLDRELEMFQIANLVKIRSIKHQYM